MRGLKILLNNVLDTVVVHGKLTRLGAVLRQLLISTRASIAT